MRIVLEGFHRANKNHPEGGTCLEFGVFVGSTYMMQVDSIVKDYPNSKLIGFDSWEGLPEETSGVWAPERHAKGKFRATRQVVENKLKDKDIDTGDQFMLIDGFFSETLTAELQESIENLIFVNIDVDIHSSTVEVLDFIYPLLQKGTILYFDDWKDPKDKYEGEWGEHLAWGQFIEKHPEIKYDTLVINQWNQRFMEIV